MLSNIVFGSTGSEGGLYWCSTIVLRCDIDLQITLISHTHDIFETIGDPYINKNFT
jgi:hypothetical protein